MNRIGARLRKIAKGTVDVVRDINAGQQALWESYDRLDHYLINPQDPRYLHWEPGGGGWRLRGELLPPADRE
ncbi:MAG: hypothetical protein ACRDRN_17225 [Sciscionella sp.]